MSALSVKPSHKAQSMLLGPPCVYLCRQEGSEPTRTATSTYPSIQPSFSNHLFSLSISAVLFIPSTPCCDIFYAIADASCFAWYAYLHPPAAHPQMLWFFLCVCVSFCAASWFKSFSWRIRFLYQLSICGHFMAPSQQLFEQMQFSLVFFYRRYLLLSACPEMSCQPAWQTGADGGLLVMFGSNCLLELICWSINSFSFVIGNAFELWDETGRGTAVVQGKQPIVVFFF